MFDDVLFVSAMVHLIHNSTQLFVFHYLQYTVFTDLCSPTELSSICKSISTMISLLTRPFLLSVTTTLVIITISWCCTDAFTFTSTSSSTQQPISQQNKNNRRRISSYSTSIFTASASSGGEDTQQRQQESTRTPKTFREGEIMGLRLMQDGRPEDALKGTYVYLC